MYTQSTILDEKSYKLIIEIIILFKCKVFLQ